MMLLPTKQCLICCVLTTGTLPVSAIKITTANGTRKASLMTWDAADLITPSFKDYLDLSQGLPISTVGLVQSRSFEGQVPERLEISGETRGEIRGEVIRGKVTRGEVTRGEVTRGEVTRGEVTRGEVNRGKVTKAKFTREKVTRGEVSREKVTRGQATRGSVTRGGVIRERVTIGEATREKVTIGEVTKAEVTKELIKFFAISSTARNIYVIYEDQVFPEVTASIEACFQMTSEVTLLTCEEVTPRLKGIIRSFSELESRQNIVVLCSPSVILALFQEIHSKYLESASTHWFVVLEEDQTTSFLPYMREGTQVTFAVKKDDSKYQLMNSYVSVNNKITLRHMGWWSWDNERGPTSNLEAPLLRPLKEIYSDFGGRVLTATVVDNWPFWVLEYPGDGSVKPVSGLDFHVLTDIGQKLNFTFRVELTPEGVWGGVMPDGSVTGMVGEVHRHAVHLAINELTLTEKRSQAVDYTTPYFLESTTLISPAPSKHLKPHAVFTSFPYEVWILLICVTLVMGPLVRGVVWFRMNHMGEVKTAGKEWESLQDATFLMFKSMVLQPSISPPDGWVYGLLFMSWYFFCTLIIALYSDVMISMLAVPSYERPINSLWDLLEAIKNRGYMTVISCGSNNEFIFSNTDQKIYQDIWQRFDRSKGCIRTWDEGMDKVLTGKFALVNNRMGAEVRANLRGRERFHFALNEFYAHGYAIACPKGSPYRDVFQDILSQLMWSGLVAKYTEDELMKARRSGLHGEKGPEAISIRHLQAAFYLFVAGNVWASVALLLERAIHYYQRTTPPLWDSVA